MQKRSKIILWAPRIISIAFILFLSLFSLDVFEEGKSIGYILLGLLIHNIPSLVLLAVVVISWKHELVGAVAFIAAGTGFIILSSINVASDWIRYICQVFLIGGPAILTGILFLVSWKKKKKPRK